MNKVLIFILSFIAPLIYWRSLFYFVSKIFDKPFTRAKTGLQVHHIHYGILFVLISSIILLFNQESNFVIILLGLGLGLMLDEFIPSLLMPGNRSMELEIYRKSFSKTIYLFLIIIVVILLISASNTF